MWFNAVSLLSCLGGQKFWILWQAWTDSHFCPLPWSWWGIRNSKYLDDHEQISIFVPCRDWGSKILNPWGIKNRLLFCSVKLWAGGSEILDTFITMTVFVLCHDGDQKFWLLLELKIDYCFVLLRYGPGDQKFWISPRKKAQWVYDLFHMKLHNLMELENWMSCFLWTQLNTFFSPSN